MPEIGEQKTFPNGKVGRWDGAGWEHVPDPGASPAAPPEAAHQDPSQEPSLLNRFLTKVAAPVAGGIAGGMIGGPIGMGIGAAGGKAYGDLYNMAAHHEIPDPTEEALSLAGTGVGAGVTGAIAPSLQNLPGPFKLANIGLGAAGGYGAGMGLGHPGLGAAVGAGMGGYNLVSGLLKGVGGMVKGAATPRFGAQEAWGIPVVAGAEAGAEGATGSTGPKLPGSVIPPDPDPGDFTPRMNAMWAKKGGSPSGDIRGGQPSQPPMPTSAQVSPAGGRPRLSTEIPYQAPSSMGGLIQSAPDGLDALTTVPRASNLPRVGNSVMPNLSKSPNLSYGADVTTPGDYVTPQLEQSAPSEAPWEDHVSRSAAVGRAPARTSTQGATYSVSRTPEEALRGLHLPGDPVSEVNDLPNGGPKVKSGGSVDPAKAEFPPSWKEGQDPSTWNDTWNMDYNKAMGNPTPNAALQALMDRLRSAVARKP